MKGRGEEGGERREGREGRGGRGGRVREGCLSCTWTEGNSAAGRSTALSAAMHRSARRACCSSGKRFSYSEGSARACAALVLVLARSSRHSPTTLEGEGAGGLACSATG